MQTISGQLLLAKTDYEAIMGYIKLGAGRTSFNRRDAEELEKELKKATLVSREDLPRDVVRLNSTVKIREEKAAREMELTLVSPEKADIKQKKISILSPIGTALIGFCKGQIVSWNVPAGTKTFTILDVVQG
jgi:regulator of nucleoside diphosphate kinase